MTKDLVKIFHYQGNQVRTVKKDDEFWLVARNVCDILEITNSRDALSRLDEDENTVGTDGTGKKRTPPRRCKLCANPYPR